MKTREAMDRLRALHPYSFIEIRWEPSSYSKIVKDGQFIAWCYKGRVLGRIPEIDDLDDEPIQRVIITLEHGQVITVHTTFKRLEVIVVDEETIALQSEQIFERLKRDKERMAEVYGKHSNHKH